MDILLVCYESIKTENSEISLCLKIVAHKLPSIGIFCNLTVKSILKIP